MWMLNFLPNWLFYALLLISGGGLFLSTFFAKLPFVGNYARAIQVGSIIGLVFSVYMCGGIANEEGWQKKVLEQQAEIAQLKQKEAEVSTKVVTKYIDKITVVKETNNAISKYVTKDSDSKCDLPVSFSVLHDAAAKNQLPDATRVTDASSSGVALSEATSAIIDNYGLCNQNTEQLKAIQEWIREQQKLNP